MEPQTWLGPVRRPLHLLDMTSGSEEVYLSQLGAEAGEM